MKNDFEKPVFEKYPEIKKIKDKLYDTGAIYASMSGSGSAVYGIFEKKETFSFSFPENYFVKEVNVKHLANGFRLTRSAYSANRNSHSDQASVHQQISFFIFWPLFFWFIPIQFNPISIRII